VELGKPGYLRIGKANEPAIHVQEPNVLPNRFLVVREGSDVTLITTGGVLGLGLEAAAELQTRGISAEVLSLPFVAPLDATTVELIAQRTGHLVTIEEHVQGGLGGAIAEHLCNLGSDAKLRTCTLQLAKAPGVAGSQTYLRERMGLTTDNVVSAAIRLVQPSSGAVAA
jgi:transketolase